MKNTDISDIYSRAAAPIEDFCAAFQNALNALNVFNRNDSLQNSADAVLNTSTDMYRANDKLLQTVIQQSRILGNMNSVGKFFSADNKNYNQENSTRQLKSYRTETYSIPNNSADYSDHIRNSDINVNSAMNNKPFTAAVIPLISDKSAIENQFSALTSENHTIPVEINPDIYGITSNSKYSVSSAVSRPNCFNGNSVNYPSSSSYRGYAFFNSENTRLQNDILTPRALPLQNSGKDIVHVKSSAISASKQALSLASLQYMNGGDITNSMKKIYAAAPLTSSMFPQQIINGRTVFNSAALKEQFLHGGSGRVFFNSEKYFPNMPVIGQDVFPRNPDTENAFNSTLPKILSLHNTNTSGGNVFNSAKDFFTAPWFNQAVSPKKTSVGYFSNSAKNSFDIFRSERTSPSSNIRTNNDMSRRNISYTSAAHSLASHEFDGVFGNIYNRQSYRNIQTDFSNSYSKKSAPFYRFFDSKNQILRNKSAAYMQIPAQTIFSDSGQSASITKIESVLQPVSKYMYEIGNAPFDEIREGLSSAADNFTVFGDSAYSAWFSFAGMSSAAAAWNAAVSEFAAALGAAAGYAAILDVLSAVMLSAVLAQSMLNDSILACPVFWIIGGFSSFIGAIYAAAQNIGNVYALTISFGGMIGGYLMTVIAGAGNGFIAFYNLIAQGIAASQNVTADFANFLLNVFQNPLRAVVQLFAGAFGSVLSIIESVANAIGSLLGQDFGGNISNLKQKLQSAVDAKYGKNTEYVKKVDLHAFDMKYLNYKDFYKAGYTAGTAVTENIIPNFDSNLNLRTPQSMVPSVNVNYDLNNFFNINDSNVQTNNSKSGTSSRSSGTSRSTAKSAAISGSSVTNDDIEYIRDIAERDVVNRFTTARISVSMGGITQNVNSDADLDGIVNYLANGVRNAMEKCAEGVHV